MRFQKTLLVIASLLQNSYGRKNLRKAKAQKPQKRNEIETLDLTKLKTIEQGENDRDLQARIIGGDQSDIGEFPYFVYLGGCGGSLIAPGVVLSAAHCGSFVGDEVYVGAYELDKTTGGAQKVKVVAEALHPEYNKDTFRNDFVLFRLKDPVSLDTDIKFSINTLGEQPAPGQDLTALGLGATQPNGYLEQYLQDVNVKAISVDDCNKPNRYSGDIEGDVMFCAGVNGGGKDSCQGDSGGPLVIRNGNEHIQVGVVSWGYGCARPNFPGVYARVSSAKDWIRSVVCDDWGLSAEFCDGGFQPTASPTLLPTDPPLTCPGDEIAFEFTIRTDEWAEETSWNLKDSEDNLILSGGDYTNDESYDTRGCIPNACYTLAILDTYGDGLSEGGSNPGYTLIVDDTLQEEAGGVNFGFEKKLIFGNCVAATPPPTPVLTPPPTVASTPPPTPGSTPPPTSGATTPTSGVTPPPSGSTPPPTIQTPSTVPSLGFASFSPTSQTTSTPSLGATATTAPSDSQGACATDEMEFDWTIITDEWGSETSWILRNLQSDEILRGENYEDDTEYTAKQCIPKKCYTVTIFDSYGDGLSVGGTKPGYRLLVDGTLVAEAGGVNFGYQRAIPFGDCSPEADCVPLKLKLQTDNYASESSFTLTKDGVVALDKSGFDNNEDYVFSDCLKPSQCNKLEIRDSYGDGITNGRGIEIELDGDVKYNNGDFGYGIGFQYGDC